MTPFPTSGTRPPRGLTSTLLALALAAAPCAAAPAQEPAEPVPAPVVRVQRHAPATSTPGASQTAPSPALTPATPLTQAHPAPRTTPATRPTPVTRTSPGTQTLPATQANPNPQPNPVPHKPRPAANPNAPTGTTASPASGTKPTSTTSTPASSPTAAAPAAAAKPPKPATPEHPNTIRGLNRNVIVLDPGHGGSDSGARIGDTTLEKNVTLALAFRLRSLLLARGFTVVLTRDSDAATTQTTSPSTSQTTSNAAPAPLTLDDRAGVANHAHAAACLLLHATGRGTGLHVYSSEITPVAAEPYLVPWLTGQAAWLPASKALGSGLAAALGRSGVPLLSSTASVRPIDSLTCPALVLELAPENDTPASINDAGYQERVAAALAGALVVWENTVQPPPRLPAPPRPVHHTAADTSSAAPATSTPETQP